MKTLITLIALLFAGSAFAQEQIAVTTPITFTAPPTINAYQPILFTVQPVAAGFTVHPAIHVQIGPVGGTAAQVLTFDYPCPVGTCANDTDAAVTTLITALNTANLATRSLWRRVFDRLCLDFPSKFPNGCTVQ